MTAGGQSPQPVYALAAGDPARPAIRRAVFAALLVAVVFSVLTGPVKQIAALYDHAPWLGDPFDTAVSFAMFFVPLIAACCLVRLPLCRRSEPLPLARAADLLRGCRAVLGVVAITLLTEWAAVAAGANRPQWNEATWLQVGLLALMTVLTAWAVIDLRKVPPPARSITAETGPGPDCLADLVAIAALQSHWLGPLHGPALRALSWTDRRLLALVSRHPLRAAAIAAAAFGVAAGGNQAIREGYVPLAALLVITLLGCGMFAFLVTAGSYLGLVRSSAALGGGRRRVLDAGVLACAGTLVVLAFRNSLWWIVGSRADAAGMTQTYALLGLAALAIFAVVLAFESLRNYHARTGG